MKRETTGTLFRDMDGHTIEVLREQVRQLKRENLRLKDDLEFLAGQMQNAVDGFGKIANQHRMVAG